MRWRKASTRVAVLSLAETACGVLRGRGGSTRFMVDVVITRAGLPGAGGLPPGVFMAHPLFQGFWTEANMTLGKDVASASFKTTNA